MKPRNKREREVLELHKLLPPLTDMQMSWGWGLFKPKGFYRTIRGGRGLVWCSECGREVDDEATDLECSLGVGAYWCPDCGEKLALEYSLKKSKQEAVSDGKQVSFLDTCRGWQVVRTFAFCVDYKRGERAQRSVHELYEHWYDSEGKEVIIGIDYTRTVWSFTWRYGTEMSVKAHNGHCSGYFVWEDIFTTKGNYVYPAANITPILRRNGWCARLLKLKCGVGETIKHLLWSPDGEWLAKVKQWKILEWLINKGDYQLPYKYAVKVALRAGYKIRDVQMWFDYLDLLAYFEKDLHNAHYVCPDNLRKAHDRLVMKRRERERMMERKAKELEARKHEKEYQTSRGLFFGVCFDDGKIYCHVLKSVQEFVDEADAMHHCVYDNEYWNEKRHPDSLILSARDKDGERVETVEVSTKTWRVVQSRGRLNSRTAYHGEIIALVDKYMPLIKKTAYNANSKKITINF